MRRRQVCRSGLTGGGSGCDTSFQSAATRSGVTAGGSRVRSATGKCRVAVSWRVFNCPSERCSWNEVIAQQCGVGAVVPAGVCRSAGAQQSCSAFDCLGAHIPIAPVNWRRRPMTRMNATRRMSPLAINHDTQLRSGRQQCRTTLSCAMPPGLLGLAPKLSWLKWRAVAHQVFGRAFDHGECLTAATTCPCKGSHSVRYPDVPTWKIQ